MLFFTQYIIFVTKIKLCRRVNHVTLYIYIYIYIYILLLVCILLTCSGNKRNNSGKPLYYNLLSKDFKSELLSLCTNGNNYLHLQIFKLQIGYYYHN